MNGDRRSEPDARMLRRMVRELADEPLPELEWEGIEARLFAELIRRGWSNRNLAKLAGGNLLRALRQAEAVSQSMKDNPASMAVLEEANTAP